MCDHQKPWQHHCSHTPLHEHTAHGGADEGEQSPAGLCPSLDDLPSVSPSDFHVAFEGWSIRSLLFSSFSLFHLNPPSASFFFYFSIPCISSISSTCSNFSEPCLLFLQHGLHPFRMWKCTISFSSVLAAGVSLRPCQRSDLQVPNMEGVHNQHGDANNSDYLTYQNNPAPRQPACLVFCCQVAVGYEQPSPTEVMGITQKHIKPAITKCCWKRWDWVLWLLVAYEKTILKYYFIWKTPVNSV